MPKDLKIGMVVGLVVIAVAGLWLATRPSLSIKSRMQESYDGAFRPEYTEQPGLAADSANSNPRATADGGEIGELESSTATDKLREPDELKLPSAAPVEQVEKIKTQKFHIVRRGETLSDISYKYYGSANKWQKLFDANRDVIDDVNKLRAGVKLIIPE